MVLSKALTAALALTTLAGASAGTARATDVVIRNIVTLHAGPGEKFQIVSNLGAGEQITVLWCNGANWCRVQSNLFEGWAPITQLLPKKALDADIVLGDGGSNADNPDIAAILAASAGGSSDGDLLGGSSGGGSSSSSASSTNGGGSSSGSSVSVGGGSLLGLKVR